ncbi:unnamed protein product [Rotaria socialis]
MTINDDSGPQSNTSNKSSDNTRGPSADKENDLSVNSPSIFEKERQVLNLYGRYILIRRRGTIIFLTILVGILISTALVATCNNLILSSTSVYRDGPCPAFGPMECFAGHDAIYFACNTGLTAPFPVSDAAGTCFRWIARDITISDVLTQLGVATGLLLALGNIAQAIIRIYLLAFNKRLGIATGIHRIAAKTIGINKHTAQTKCCCCSLCWHCSACNCKVFKHPAAVIIVTAVYCLIPLLIAPAIILLYYYQLTVTSLTFVFLIAFGIVSVLSLIWIMVQEDEATSNIPGGWDDMKRIFRQL